MSGAVLLLPNVKFSWAAQGQLYPLFFILNKIQCFVEVGGPHIAGAFRRVC